MVPWWLLVDLPNISAITDHFKMWLVSIERSFQGLLGAIKTVGIVKELMEIWLNEVCDFMSRTCGAGVELLQNRRNLTTKWEQPWPQLVHCASICCHVCGCIFQEDWIVARSFGEEWYRLIGVRIKQGEDINDFNLRTKELGCNYWSTYTKSRIGVPVTSLHRDPIRVDNRSLGAKN